MVYYKARVLNLLNSRPEVCIKSTQMKLGNWKSSHHLREDRGKPRKLCRDGRLRNHWDSEGLLASRPANKRWNSPQLPLMCKLLLQIHVVQKPSIIPVALHNSSHFYSTSYIVSLSRYTYVVWAVLSATYGLSIWSSGGICLMLPVSLIIRMFGIHLILFAWLRVNRACVGVQLSQSKDRVRSGHYLHSCPGLADCNNCVDCILRKRGGNRSSTDIVRMVAVWSYLFEFWYILTV